MILTIILIAAAFVGGYLVGWTRGKKGYAKVPLPGQP